MIHYLGIDAGGSNCRARLIDARGVVVGEGRSGPANARIGIEALYATLMETADTAIAEAGLSDEARGAIRAGMGIAGITRLGMREALEALDFGFAATARFVRQPGLGDRRVRRLHQRRVQRLDPDPRIG
ncbi:MAG: hypothetical protein EOP67_66250, partial [Sphingomonas sp.]